MRNLCIMVAVLCCMLLVSCRETPSTIETKEAKDQRIRQANSLEMAGKTNEAMQAYESVLRIDPDNGLAALGLAMLLQEQPKDFTNMLKSAYWYQRYLETHPDAEKKNLIDKRLQVVRLHLAANIVKSEPPVTPVEGAEPPVRLQQPPSERPPVTEAIRPLLVRPVTPATYVVKSGDSLSSIAEKVYGDGSKWTKLYEANREILKTSEDLKIGQTLKVP